MLKATKREVDVDVEGDDDDDSMMTKVTWFPPLHRLHGSLAKYTERSSCTWDLTIMATLAQL